MQETVMLSVSEIVGGSLCVAFEDGEKLYRQIASKLKEGCGLVLLFDGIEKLTPAFLNAAFGRLYATFDQQQLHSLIQFRALGTSDRILFSSIVEINRQYHGSPQRFNQAMRETFGSDENDR